MGGDRPRSGGLDEVQRDKAPFQGCGGDFQPFRRLLEPASEGICIGPRSAVAHLKTRNSGREWHSRQIDLFDAQLPEARLRYEQRGGKAVRELLDTDLAGLRRLFEVLGRHRIPCEDVEKLVGEIEVASAGDFATVDDHHVEVGKTAGGSGDAVDRVHHEHQDAELLLHDLRQLLGRDGPEIEILRETLAGRHRIFISASWRELQSVTEDRTGPADLSGQRPVRRDPSARDALESIDVLRADPRLPPPRELAVACELEWVGEIVDRRAELFDRQQEFLGRDAALPGLDRRDGLAVLKAEDAREVVLGELALLPEGFEANRIAVTTNRIKKRRYKFYRTSFKVRFARTSPRATTTVLTITAASPGHCNRRLT